MTSYILGNFGTYPVTRSERGFDSMQELFDAELKAYKDGIKLKRVKITPMFEFAAKEYADARRAEQDAEAKFISECLGRRSEIEQYLRGGGRD